MDGNQKIVSRITWKKACSAPAHPQPDLQSSLSKGPTDHYGSASTSED